MSSLWTPGGEVPVDRDRDRGGPEGPPPGPAGDPTHAQPSEEEIAAQAAELQRYLLESPAEDVVAQHAMGLYELAVIHLSQAEPRLTDARLAIDALAALVDGLEGRLGEVGRQLRQALPQIQMAYVQIADRSGGDGDGEPSGDPS